MVGLLIIWSQVYIKQIVTQSNFDHLVDSTTSIHFIQSKFDHGIKCMEVVELSSG